MIEAAFKEIAKKAMETTSKELPNFAKNLKESSVKSFSEADKPLNLSKNESNGVNKIKTINQHLEGKTHEKHNIPFEKKIVNNENNESVEVVVPKFESMHDVQLPKELETVSDRKQFKYCNNDLKETMNKNPDLKNKFNDAQIKDIENNETPKGYSWHHDAEKGKMQLVDFTTHSDVRHTGGKFIWGGGTENR